MMAFLLFFLLLPAHLPWPEDNKQHLEDISFCLKVFVTPTPNRLLSVNFHAAVSLPVYFLFFLMYPHQKHPYKHSVMSFYQTCTKLKTLD